VTSSATRCRRSCYPRQPDRHQGVVVSVEQLSRRVRSVYLQQRTPVAFVLVALVTVAGVTGYVPLLLAASVALLALVLQVLFEIERRVSEKPERVYYSTFQEALHDMNAELERRMKNGQIRVRWIGVTQEAGWPFIQNLLLSVLDHRAGKNASMQVELALLDPDGTICTRSDGPDAGQIRTTKEKIARFAQARSADLIDNTSAIAVYMYDHRPTWHAMLVDDDLMYYSTSIPSNLPFASPQGGVEVIRAGASDAEAERVRHFVAWFESIATDARVDGRFFASQSTESGAP